MINPTKVSNPTCLWISSEPSPESLQQGALRLCRSVWHSINCQKLHWFTVFHISI